MAPPLQPTSHSKESCNNVEALARLLIISFLSLSCLCPEPKPTDSGRLSDEPLGRGLKKVRLMKQLPVSQNSSAQMLPWLEQSQHTKERLHYVAASCSWVGLFRKDIEKLDQPGQM